MFGDFFKKTPILFLAVALFHLLMLGHSIWMYSDFSFPSIYWIPVLWLLVYLISWLFICRMRRRAAWLYLGLTSVNILLHYTLSYQSEIALYTPPFLLVYIIFCFFILVYYKRFT